MSLPRYAEYKDSGVAWLGDVPAHWLITPVKHLGKLKGGAGFQHVEQGHETEELPFHKVNALGRAGSDGVLWGSENNISRATAERLGAYIFPAHALVFAKVGAALLLGRIRTLGEAACIDNNMMGLVVDNDDVDVAFVSYALNLVRFDLIANPGAVPSLNEGQIGNFPLVLPSRSEQSAIAAFLDHETGKIDALIAEQEKLLTLLAEKRQATIAHAVTRGLNPNAPMKDSGVPWLGEVPSHWMIVRIKHAVRSIEQGWSPQCEGYPAETPDEWGVLKVGCVNGGVFTSSENKRLPDELEPITQYALKQGDLLISRANTRELVGGAAVVTEDHPKLLLCDKLYRLRMDAALCVPEFLAAFLSIGGARSQIELRASGASSSMLNIGQSVILDMPVTLPSIEEQLQIVDFIRSERQRLEELQHESMCAITLLKERRSALIAAAVTGKIDVRQAA